MKEFYQLDVFTDKPLTGNPLAVFPDGAGISDEAMQKIALEMNLSETVFVLPSDKPNAVKRLRIFTPIKELPIAGHPVVGTWNLLARLGVVENAPENGKIEILHELGVGVLPVEIDFLAGQPQTVTMTAGGFAAGEAISDSKVINDIAESLNLQVSDLAVESPIQVCGIGVNFTIVPVRSLTALKKSKPNPAKMEMLPKTLSGEFSLFTFETLEPDSAIHTRMYAPEFGIIEDPATGSAAGTLGGYLVTHGLLDQKFLNNKGVYEIKIEQGDFMNRPSRISVQVQGAPDKIETIKIGGSSVIIVKGEMFL